MMPSFIGKPLKDCVDYCNNNGLEYVVNYNTYTENEPNLKDFVVKTSLKNNKVIIVASKFKLEV